MALPAGILDKYKRNIGDLLFVNNPLDDSYTQFLEQAYSYLISNDISDDELQKEDGQACIIMIARNIRNQEDLLDNSVKALMYILQARTKGERYDV